MGGDLGDLVTTVDDIGVYKRCTVIRRAAFCNRLSGERGAGGMGWWGVRRWRRCLEVGMCKMMGLMMNVCSYVTAAAIWSAKPATCVLASFY